MSWKFLNKKNVSKERMLCLIKSPIVTEKSTLGSQYNQYSFKVVSDASKHEVKQAVEDIFKVGVVNVQTLIRKGKSRRFKGVAGKTSNYKKAIVTLKQGDTIDFGVTA